MGEIDYNRTVTSEPELVRPAQDIFRKGLTGEGLEVALRWSPVTGELFTVVEEGALVPVEVFGRLQSYELAVVVGERCPIDPQGLTLVDAVRGYFG